MIEAIATEKLTLESLLSRVNGLASVVTELQTQLARKDEIIAQKDQIIDRLTAQNLQLKHELSQLKKMVFGARSERFVPTLSPQQLTLGFELPPLALPAPTQQVTYTRKQAAAGAAKHPGRLPLPAHLPRQQVVLEPEGVEGWKKIGEEITEELDYAPGKLFVRQYVRPKYVSAVAEETKVVCASLPERPITKGIAGPALLAYLIIGKFVDHLPIYRQLEQFKREGVTIAASTVNDWLTASCRLLEPLYQRLLQLIRESDYLQADESPLKVLDKAKKSGTTKGYHWLYHSPQKRLVLFDYRPGRGPQGPVEILKGFKGYLQTDGYVVYEGFGSKSGITRLCCWAHVRRKFVEAQGNDAARASHVLAQIQQLYALERQAKEKAYTAEQLKELRQEKAVPVLEALKPWLVEHYQKVTPASVIGKAIAYTLGLWEELAVYVQDGRLLIDNNSIENAVRPMAIGRKNYLFAGSQAGAERAAMFYSFMGSCKMHNINPQLWLTDVLERLPTHPINKIEELLPHKWIAAVRL